MNEKEIILEAMKKAGEPLNAGKVAELAWTAKSLTRPSQNARRTEAWCHPSAVSGNLLQRKQRGSRQCRSLPGRKRPGDDLSFCFRMPEAFINFSGGQTASLFSSSFRVRMISSRCRKMKPGLVSS